MINNNYFIMIFLFLFCIFMRKSMYVCVCLCICMWVCVQAIHNFLYKKIEIILYTPPKKNSETHQKTVQSPLYWFNFSHLFTKKVGLHPPPMQILSKWKNFSGKRFKNFLTIKIPHAISL